MTSGKMALPLSFSMALKTSAGTDDIVVSVIIPCRNQVRELEACLHGLRRQDLGLPWEIVVVDSSDDESASVVADFAGVRLVRSRIGMSAAAARNLGTQCARGEVLSFIDADCVPERRWLREAMAALKSSADLVGGPVLDLAPWHPIRVIDNLLQFADQGPARPEGDASYFPGCNMALSRAAFFEVGGFPDVAGGEDVMFSAAAARRWPGRVRFLPHMRVRHAGRSDFQSLWRHQRSLGYCRGARGLRISRRQQSLGRFRAVHGLVIAARLNYLALRTATWHPARLPMMLLGLPIVLFGLAAWAIGFRQGCMTASRGEAERRAGTGVTA